MKRTQKEDLKKRKSEDRSMIKPIVTDVFFLGQKSEQAVKQDLPVGQDLQDTLQANRERCVGMAANMIGVKKRIIIVNMGLMNLVMFNPVLIRKDTPYETEEGCLSLPGVRKTTRYRNIEVEYLDASWKKHRQKYSGWTAQIIQHELDHLEGRII
jgi:peptide deformylase